MLSENIRKLVEYGIQTGLVPETERIYTTNLLLEMFREDDYEDVEVKTDADTIELEPVLKELLDEAVKRGIIEDSIGYRDLFDTKLMNCLVPRPAQVQEIFAKKYEISPREATEYYYKLSQDSDYIRRYRVKKDMKWKVDSPYGEIDITINLSKPEKDPKAIAAARNAKVSMKAMPDAWIIRRERITGSSPSPSMTANGDSSTLRMSITMSTVSYLTGSMYR